MAFAKRTVTYRADVEGFDKAEKAVKGADKAAEGAAKSAKTATRGFSSLGDGASQLGERFDGLNDRLNKTWGRAGDVISRVGDLEDMIRIFSGFVLLDAIQTASAFVQEMYRMTDAGRKAQSMAEGLAEGLKKVTNGLDNVDIRKAVQLAALMGKAKEQTSEYQRALDAAIDRQVELNAEIEKKLKLEEQGRTDSYEYRNTLRNIAILTEAVESQISVAEVEKQKAQERAFAAGQVNRALEGQIKATQNLIPNLLQSAEATAKAAIETAKYRLELQRSGGQMTSILDVFARLGAAGVRTWDGVSKAVDNHRKGTKAATKTLSDYIRKVDELNTAVIDLDNLPAFDFGEFFGEVDESGVDEFFPDEEDMGKRLKSAYELAEAIRKVREEIEAATRAFYDGLGPAGDLVRNIVDAFEKDGVDAVLGWSRAVQAAVELVQSSLAAVSAAIGASMEATLAPLKNSLTLAQERLAVEQQRERYAKTDEEAAAAARKREKAEWAVYEAQMALIAAEEEAAETQKKIKALEFALNGTLAAAKAIEMGALAFERFATYRYAEGVAATAAAVAYGTAAVAYGAAAAATASAPSVRQQRPNTPDDQGRLSEAERSRTLGSGRGGEGSTTVVNVNFAGQSLHTDRDVQRAIRAALKESESSTGLPSPNFAKIGRA